MTERMLSLRLSLHSLLFFLVTIIPLHAQDRLIHSLSVPDIKHASVDRIGNLILQVGDNEIRSYNPDGKLIGSFKSELPIVSIDPWNGIRILVFQQSDQITWLDTSLEVQFSGKFDPAFVINPLVVCSTPDFNVLVVDSATWSLKLIDIRNNILKSEKHLSLSDPLLDMKEYQGFIFLKTPGGLTILNKIGTQIKTVDASNISYLNFLGEEFYYKQGKDIVFYDLLEGTQRREKTDADILLYTQDRAYQITGSIISIFSKNDQ